MDATKLQQEILQRAKAKPMAQNQNEHRINNLQEKDYDTAKPIVSHDNDKAGSHLGLMFLQQFQT